MSARPLVGVMLAVTIASLNAREASALDMRVVQVRVAASRLAATFELRDLLRGRFLELVQQGRSIFLQVRAELWEDRRITDRLTLTTPALTYRLVGDGQRGLVMTNQYGDRSIHTDLPVVVPLRLDLGPASVLADDRAYYLRAQLTAATVADREIDQWGTAIFGDEQSVEGLAGLGRFVFSTLLRIGKYLESASAEATSTRYTGRQIRAGVN